MCDGWSKTVLSDVMDFDPEQVAVEPDAQFEMAGVYSFGRGLFHRNPLAGSSTAYKTLHRLRHGQLVMSKLKAWEGAVAVVTEEFTGCHLSPEFPTFTLAPCLLPEYMSLIAQQEEFWRRLQDESTGMGGRRERVHPQRLLAVEIDLPPTAQQRRIVDLVAAVDDAMEAALAYAQAAAAAQQGLLARVRAETVHHVKIGDLAKFEYGKALKETDRRDGKVAVFGSAGRVGQHDEACSGPGPVIVVGRKGVHAPSTLPLALRDGTAVEHLASYRGVGGAGSVRWWGDECWVIDTAYRVVPTADISPLTLYWLLVMADLPRIATKTTLPGLNREQAYGVQVPAPGRLLDENIEQVEALQGASSASMLVADRLRHLRKALLHELLSGGHTIPESYDSLLEPA